MVSDAEAACIDMWIADHCLLITLDYHKGERLSFD